MRDYEKELGALRERIARLRQNRVRREALYAQEAEVQEEAERLCRTWDKEQKDVDDLDRLTFSAIWANLSGRKAEKLEKEEAEAFAARMKYEAAARQLSEIREEIERCEAELREDEGCEERFCQVLREKQEDLKANNAAAAEKIRALEERLTELAGSRRELEEAVSAGETVLRQTEAVYGSLNSAGNWGTWDVLGGGLLTDMMKYSRLDDAQRGMEQLQSALRRYRAELADVTALHIGEFRPEGFSMVLDVFFDNVFSDWMVLDRINSAASQIEALRHQVEGLQATLADDLEQTCGEAEAVRRELDELVENA